MGRVWVMNPESHPRKTPGPEGAVAPRSRASKRPTAQPLRTRVQSYTSTQVSSSYLEGQLQVAKSVNCETAQLRVDLETPIPTRKKWMELQSPAISLHIGPFVSGWDWGPGGFGPAARPSRLEWCVTPCRAAIGRPSRY